MNIIIITSTSSSLYYINIIIIILQKFLQPLKINTFYLPSFRAFMISEKNRACCEPPRGALLIFGNQLRYTTHKPKHRLTSRSGKKINPWPLKKTQTYCNYVESCHS